MVLGESPTRLQELLALRRHLFNKTSGAVATVSSTVTCTHNDVQIEQEESERKGEKTSVCESRSKFPPQSSICRQRVKSKMPDIALMWSLDTDTRDLDIDLPRGYPQSQSIVMSVITRRRRLEERHIEPLRYRPIKDVPNADLCVET